MTREEYIEQLKLHLQSLTIDEQTEAIQYYSDYFEEASDDEKVMSELGNPEELAKSIVEKCANAPAKSEKQSSDSESQSKTESDSNSSGVLYYSFESSDVKNMSLDFGAADVVMISGSRYQVETRYVEEGGLACFLTSDGTLYVNNSRRLNLNFLSHDRRFKSVPRILITVPENADLYNLNIHVGAGNFRSQNVTLRCQNGNLEVSAGNLVLKDLLGGKIDLRCGMGNLEMDGSLNGKSNIDCGMGNIKLNLRGSSEDYSFDARVGLGEFRFNDIKKSGICQEYGKQKKTNHFSVNCGMGSVSISVK